MHSAHPGQIPLWSCAPLSIPSKVTWTPQTPEPPRPLPLPTTPCPVPPCLPLVLTGFSTPPGPAGPQIPGVPDAAGFPRSCRERGEGWANRGEGWANRGGCGPTGERSGSTGVRTSMELPCAHNQPTSLTRAHAPIIHRPTSHTHSCTCPHMLT